MATELDEIDSLANMIFDDYHMLKPGEDFASAMINAKKAEDLAIAAHALVKNKGGDEEMCLDALDCISFVLTMIWRGTWDDIIQENT